MQTIKGLCGENEMFRTLSVDERWKVVDLFKKHRPNSLIETILEGNSGVVIVDDPDKPTLAQLAYRGSVVYGGDANHPLAEELVKDFPINRGVSSLPKAWRDLVRSIHGDNITTLERMTFYTQYLDVDHLQKLEQTLSSTFEVRKIDIELATQITTTQNSAFPHQMIYFNSVEDFVNHGVGYCILTDGKVVSVASSTDKISDNGIDVQIDTHPDFRNRGLATIVCATLLRYCLEHDIEPHWSTTTNDSRRVAEKLGYKYKDKYEVLVRTQ